MKISESYEFILSAGYKAELRSKSPEYNITGHCPLSDLREGCFTWIKSMEKGGDKIKGIDMHLLIVSDRLPDFPVSDKISFITGENPKGIYFETLGHYFATRRVCTGIAKTAVVLAPPENIGKNVTIGENCFICSNAVIGDNTIIEHNVVIECRTQIGKGCHIDSGTVIGTPGYGYYTDASGAYRKVPDFGGVIIGDNVEIGANVCIGRGTLSDTIIEDNVKIDNLCHIAHNVHIGRNCLVIAQSMLGGSSVLHDDVYVAPGAVIMNQVTVGTNALVGMGAVVIGNVEENKVVVGVPARVIRDNKKR